MPRFTSQVRMIISLEGALREGQETVPRLGWRWRGRQEHASAGIVPGAGSRRFVPRRWKYQGRDEIESTAHRTAGSATRVQKGRHGTDHVAPGPANQMPPAGRGR